MIRDVASPGQSINDSPIETGDAEQIPPFIRAVPDPVPQTFPVLIDGEVSAGTLARALATRDLCLKSWNGNLVLTHRPEAFK